MTTTVSDRWNRPIFVASMGRSGSTLLQRVLNVHPRITIWGEHGGFLSGILQSYVAARRPDTIENLRAGYEAREQVVGELADKGAFQPWVSPFSPGGLEDRMSGLIRDLFTEGLDPSIRWGFKEIRYAEPELRILMEMFPEAHLVVLARDFRGFAQSRFFAFGNTDFDFESDDGRDAVLQRLIKMSTNWARRYNGLLKLHDELSDRVSLVSYSDLTLGNDRPARLFQELGEEVFPRAIDEVLSTVSGSSFRYNEAARQNRETFVELIDEAKINWTELQRVSKLLGCDE